MKIPESENTEEIQNEITDEVKSLISNDLIIFSIDVYDDVTYKEIEELREKGIGYNSRGIERISFSLKDEED